MILKRTLKSLVAVVGGALICSTPLAAQEYFKDYQLVENSSAWLTSCNPVGLLHLKENISEAQVYFLKDNGDFIHTFESDNSYTFGVNAKSLFRINDKVVVNGHIDYRNYTGQNHTGSVYVDPLVVPFDIVEMNPLNAGKATLSEYLLGAQIGVALTNRLSLGGTIEFNATDLVKIKDLRHSTTLSELEAGVGLSYKIGSKIELGAKYSYKQRIEDVSFGVYGISNELYELLISYGSFWGEKEVYEQGKLTNGYYANPLIDITHTLGAQISYDITPNITLYAQANYGMLSGQYGVNSSTRIIYYEHHSTLMDGNIWLQINANNLKHRVKLSGWSEELTNYENNYLENSQNGMTSITYLDPSLCGTRIQSKLSGSYSLEIYKRHNLPLYTLNAAAKRSTLNQTAILYPYYRTSNIEYNEFEVGAKRNWWLNNKNVLGLSLFAHYQSGDGTPINDGTYVATTGSASYIQYDELQLKEFEYYTAEQLLASASLKYSHNFSKGRVGYIEASYAHKMALSTLQYLDSCPTTNFTLRCGFTF
ncbi:MAG: hypothetical protein R3Y49_00945 [Rikenellaceae bacterium]